MTKETAIAGVNTEEENMRSEAQLGMESAKDELMQQLESSSQQAPGPLTEIRERDGLSRSCCGDASPRSAR